VKCEWGGPDHYIFCPECGWQLIERRQAHQEMAALGIKNARLKAGQARVPNEPTCPLCGQQRRCRLEGCAFPSRGSWDGLGVRSPEAESGWRGGVKQRRESW